MIFNHHLSPMQPLLPRMYILTLRACSISTSALPDPLPLPQPFRTSAHASRPACLHPLSLPLCVTAPWKISNQHLSPMQPLLPRMYILTLRDAVVRAVGGNNRAAVE